jgi:hypothetical protein
LGGTKKAQTAAHVEDEGDGSFVIEDAVNSLVAAPHPTNHIKIATNLIHVYSCIFFDDRGRKSFPRAPGIMIPGIGAVL